MKKKMIKIVERIICTTGLLASMVGIVMAVLLIMGMFIPPYGKDTVYKFFDAIGYAGLSLLSASISLIFYYDIKK